MSKSRIPGSPGSGRISQSGRTPGAAGSAIKSKVKKTDNLYKNGSLQNNEHIHTARLHT